MMSRVRLVCVVVAGLVGCGFDPAAATDAGPGGDARGDGSVPIPIVFVREAVTTAGNGDTVTGALATQDAGDSLIAVVSWTNNTGTVMSMADTQGNTWTSAAPVDHSGQLSLQIWWTANIGAGGNQVTAMTSNNVNTPKLRLFEYAGLAKVLPVDGSSTASTSDPGAALATSSTGTVATTNAHDLLFAANVATRSTTGIEAGYTQRQLDNGHVAIDQVVTATGSYSASATLSQSASWVMTLVAFKGER
jgi:hypothetical protein